MGWAADNGRPWGMRGGAYRIVQSVVGEETGGRRAWAGQFQKADWLSEVQVLCSLKTSVSW